MEINEVRHVKNSGFSELLTSSFFKRTSQVSRQREEILAS